MFIAGDASDYFNIDSSSGDLTVAKPMDRDGPAGIRFLSNVTVTVTDTVGHVVTASLNITVTDINDNSPVCTDDIINVTVTENSDDSKLEYNLRICKGIVITFLILQSQNVMLR